jgi:hypothetical protein
VEHNQNFFTAADAESAPAPSAAPSNLPASPPHAPPPSHLDFDPIALRHRCDGWTREKQRWFIEELADCGIVREAAARVGMTEQSANRLRRRADAAAFNLAWEAAIRIGADRLRSIAYERAVLGTVKPHFYKGERVGEERIYDNRLLAWLLGRTGRPFTHPESYQVVAEWGRWMAAIEDGFDRPPPRPDANARSRVWRDEDGAWWTDFPPPPDFDSACHGEYGDEDYRRPCSREERSALDAMRAREAAEDRRQRDAYFARIE